MMSPEEIQHKLQDRNLRTVEAESGVSYQALWYIRAGRTRYPTYPTLVKLNDYFEKEL